MTTNIGLDQKKSAKLAEKLNILLANYQVFYMNVRGYHWNITGPNFFELHAKFEEIYDDLDSLCYKRLKGITIEDINEKIFGPDKS